jgi:hypothetical protein
MSTESQELHLEKAALSERSFLSQATMLVGLLALTLGLSGGVWLIWKVLNNGLMNNLEMAIVGMIPIGLAYLAGWVFSLISIRAYNNLVLPIIVRYYAWVSLAGVLALYLKVVQKLFTQGYPFPNFIAYNLVLLWALMALFGLHLIPEEHDLRPFSLPIFIIGLFQLVMMLTRYVVLPVNGNGYYIFGDLFIFALMQIVAGLMLAHLGMFNPLRQDIDEFFRQKGEIFH